MSALIYHLKKFIQNLHLMVKKLYITKTVFELFVECSYNQKSGVLVIDSKAKSTLMAFSGGCNAIYVALQAREKLHSVAC